MDRETSRSDRLSPPERPKMIAAITTPVKALGVPVTKLLEQQ